VSSSSGESGSVVTVSHVARSARRRTPPTRRARRQDEPPGEVLRERRGGPDRITRPRRDGRRARSTTRRCPRAAPRTPARTRISRQTRVRLEVDVRRVGVPDPPRSRDRVPATGRVGRGDQGAPRPGPAPAARWRTRRHRVVVEVLEHVHGHQGTEGRGGQRGGVVVHGRAGRGVPGRGRRPRRVPRTRHARRSPRAGAAGARCRSRSRGRARAAVAAHEPAYHANAGRSPDWPLSR
jgi:hypothetical protein